MISCEEVFGVDADARAEFDVVCDEWLNESILAQDAEEDLVECEGGGEQWYAHQAGANGRIEWCRKCYKNDPYYVLVTKPQGFSSGAYPAAVNHW